MRYYQQHNTGFFACNQSLQLIAYNHQCIIMQRSVRYPYYNYLLRAAG